MGNGAPNIFDQVHAEAQQQNPPPAANVFDQIHAESQASKQDQPGLLTRAWHWATATPILDNVLPKDISTKDIVRAAAFEKLTGKTYIPGIQDFDTVTQEHFGETPTKDAIKTFIAGSAKDTADLGTSMTTPVGIATSALGPASKLPGAAGTAAKALLAGSSALFAGKGVSDIAEAGLENTPEAWQQRLTGGAELVGGAAGVGAAVPDRFFSPLGKTVATPRGSIPAESFTPAQVKAYADTNGIDINAAQATNHSLPRGLQATGERSIAAGTEVKQQIAKAQAQVADHAESLADAFSPNTPDLATAGDAIKKSVQDALDNAQSSSKRAYQAIDQNANGVTVDMRPLKDTAARILGDSEFIRQAGLDPKSATRILNGILDVPDSASFSQAQQLRSALLDASRTPDVAISTQAQAWLKQAIGATDGQMMTAAKSVPGLERDFRTANNDWTQLHEDFNNPRSPLAQILQEPDPSKVPQKLTQKGQIGGSPYNAQILDRYGIDKGPVKWAIMDDLMNKNFGLRGPHLGGYSDDFLRSVFTPAELDQVYKTGAIARSVGLNANPSGTAAVTSAIEQTMNPLKAGAQAFAAKLTNSGHFNDWMMRTGASKGTTVPLAALLGATAGTSTRDNER
jgi:hypothetical protein